MIVKVKDQELAGTVREQRIGADHVGGIWGSSLQMGQYILCFQYFIGSVRTVLTADLLPVLSWAYLLPEVAALAEVTGLPVFLFRSSGIYIMSSQEARQVGPDHPVGKDRRMYDPGPLIGIKAFCRLRFLQTPQLGGIGNTGSVQKIPEQLIFQLQVIQLFLEAAYIHNRIAHFLLVSHQSNVISGNCRAWSAQVQSNIRALRLPLDYPLYINRPHPPVIQT